MYSFIYHNNLKYWDRQAFTNSEDPDHMPQANSEDPDHTPQNTACDLGLHCLPYIQQYLRHIKR